MLDEVFEIKVDRLVGKQRPRATTRGGFARMYTSAATREFETIVQDEIKRIMNKRNYEMIDGEIPLDVKIDFYFKLPNVSNKKKRMMEHQPVMKRPDVDNLEKSVLDAMNGVVFKDDCQVVSSWETKLYAGFEDTTNTIIISVMEYGTRFNRNV
jgi:Holliday junction resolvase RusA-like endonuclease